MWHDVESYPTMKLVRSISREGESDGVEAIVNDGSNCTKAGQ